MQGWRECGAVRLCRVALAITCPYLRPVIQSEWRKGPGRADAGGQRRVHNPAQEDTSLWPLLHPKLPTRLPTVASPTSASSRSSLAKFLSSAQPWMNCQESRCYQLPLFTSGLSLYGGNWGGDRRSLCSVISSLWSGKGFCGPFSSKAPKGLGLGGRRLGSTSDSLWSAVCPF